MRSRNLGTSAQLLNKAELSVIFYSVKIFLCVYLLEKVRAFCYATLLLVFDWLRKRYVAELVTQLCLFVSPVTALMKD